MTDERIATHVKAHSVNADPTQDDLLIQYTIAHRENIRRAALAIPEYLTFLKETMPKMRTQLIMDMHRYNREFCTKDGTPKEEKRDLIVETHDIPGDFYSAITNGMDMSPAAREKEKHALAIDLEIERFINDCDLSYNMSYNREIHRQVKNKAFNEYRTQENALKKLSLREFLQTLNNNNDNRYSSIKTLIDINKGVCMEFLTDFPDASLYQFLQLMRKDLQFSDYQTQLLQTSSNITTKEFLLAVQPSSQTFSAWLQSEALRMHKSALTRLDALLASGDTKQHITSAQIKKIWGAVNKEDIDDAVKIDIKNRLEAAHLPPEKIPEEILNWTQQPTEATARPPSPWE